MSTFYFRVIQTDNPDKEYSRTIHEQKLNNYRKYKWAASDKDTPIDKRVTPPRFEIHSQSTSISANENQFTITTTLYCEDEPLEEHLGEYGREEKIQP